MENFNVVPSVGTFGNSVATINANFTQAKVAIEKVQHLTQKGKGLFATLTALQTAIPSPKVGDWAAVGTSFPAELYVCNTDGTWTDSQQTVSAGNVDLSDYTTENDVLNLIEQKHVLLTEAAYAELVEDEGVDEDTIYMTYES